MKKILSSVAMAALLWGVAQPTEVKAQRALDVASTFPKNMVYLGEGAENMARLLEDVSGGKLKLKVHGAGDLVPAFEVFNAVSSGAVPAGWDWVGYWAGTVPVTGLMGAMPFGPTPEVFLGWMWEGGGLEILQKAYDPYKVKVLPCHLTAPEAGGWYNKEINTPDDFKGLKMRISGLGGKVLDRLGASTQLIPGGEIYVALERGRIDATEFSLPIIDKSLGFQNIAKYYYFPGWHQPSSWNSMLINMDVWNKYSEIEQKQFMTACRANVIWSMAVAPGAQGKVLDEFRAKGVEVKRFPDAVLDRLRTVSAEVVMEEAQKDPIFKEAYESLSAYIKTAGQWIDLQQFQR